MAVQSAGENPPIFSFIWKGSGNALPGEILEN
jgi:hypothetical protein